MRRIARAEKIARPVAATALVVAPLAWTCALFVMDLHERPAGRIAAGVVETPLEAGETVHLSLAPDSVPYRAVAMRLEAAAPAELTLRLCGPVTCDERAMKIQSTEVVTVPVPDEASRGGTLTLGSTALSGGPVSVRGEPAIPAVEVIQGYSWRLPARRAREVFRALAGTNVFDGSLAACAVALAAGFVACLTLALPKRQKDIGP